MNYLFFAPKVILADDLPNVLLVPNVERAPLITVEGIAFLAPDFLAKHAGVHIVLF